jgi:hypothetical protein
MTTAARDSGRQTLFRAPFARIRGLRLENQSFPGAYAPGCMLTPASQAKKQILHPAHEGTRVLTLETTLPDNTYDSEFDLRGICRAGILLRRDLDQCRFMHHLNLVLAGQVLAGQLNGTRGLWLGMHLRFILIYYRFRPALTDSRSHLVRVLR